jgi:hypothetical protein
LRFVAEEPELDDERERAVERLRLDEDPLLEERLDDERLLEPDDLRLDDERLDPPDFFGLLPDPPLLRRSAMCGPPRLPLACALSLTPWNGTIPPRSER